MKHLVLKTKYLVLALTLVLITSCSEDDDSIPQVLAPTITYSNTTLEVIFFQTGNSSAPTINWNGNQGSFSLANTLSGLTINTTTGVLNWTNALPIGTHNVQVIASNSAGQTTANITINNPFQGTYTGTYDNSNFFEIEFIADGTLLLGANDETNPSTASGTWILNGSIIQVDYTYDIGGAFSLSGSLSIGSSAIYSGDWYHDHGTIDGNQGGVFEMTLN